MTVVLSGGVLFITLVIAVVCSLAITDKKKLDERPVEWAVYWVAAWTPFAAVLFLSILDMLWLNRLW